MIEKTYLDVNDIMTITGVKQSKAYQIIRELNKELKKKGCITIAGQVSKKFFNEKYYF
jgi:hypothetical protein